MSRGQALTQVSRVAPAISRLSGGVTNFYLIEDGGKLTVVDAGTPADWACSGGRWPPTARRPTTWRPCC
jgi:hypothetical protein